MKTAWGIDVGDSSLKAVRLSLDENNVSIDQQDFLEYARPLSHPESHESIVQDNLHIIRSRNKFSKREPVIFGIDCQSGLVRQISFPPCDLKKSFIISQFEARQNIPFPLDEVSWKSVPIDGIIDDGMLIDGEFLLVAAKKDLIDDRLRQFPSGFSPTGIQLSSMALYNCISHLSDEKENTGVFAIISVGAQTTELIMIEVSESPRRIPFSSELTRTKFLWSRTIPLGGNHYTRQLARELKLTFAKAEHLKRNCDDRSSIDGILKKVTSDLVLEVQRSIGFFQKTNRQSAINSLIFAGGGSKVFDVANFAHIANSLTWESSPFCKANVSAPVGVDGCGDLLAAGSIPSNHLVAFGLALQGLGLAQISANLIPKKSNGLQNLFQGFKNLKRFIPRLVFDR